jgi:drug/metabolite transporter (DMT)-like permease
MHPQLRRPAGLAIPALIVGNVALALGPWLVRLARTEGEVGPIGSGFWRLALALPIMLLAARGERPQGQAADRRGPILAALVSGLFFGADLWAWHAGILHTRMSNATLFGNVTAILFPLYGFLITRTLPNGKQAAALILAIIGGGLLLGRSYELSARNVVGDLLCLAAGVCYTGYFAAAERARTMLGPWTMLCWSMIASLPLLLGAALLLGDPIWPRVWWPLILLTAGSQILGQGLMMYAVVRVSSIVMGLMLLVQPVVAATVGWVIYGERLTAFDLIGAAAIAAALLLVRDTRRPLREPRMGLSSES